MTSLTSLHRACKESYKPSFHLLSKGARIALARLNTDVRLRDRAPAFTALASIAYLEHVRTPTHYISPVCKSLCMD